MAQICVAIDRFVEIDDADWAEFSCFGIYLSKKGYAVYKYKNKMIYLHKAIYYNIDPNYIGQVDHEDNNKLNCRRDNLRPATHGQNRANSKLNSNNSSGVKGVHWKQGQYGRGQWYVQINIGGKKKYIGSYDDFAEAEQASKEAQEFYHSRFARPSE